MADRIVLCIDDIGIQLTPPPHKDDFLRAIDSRLSLVRGEYDRLNSTCMEKKEATLRPYKKLEKDYLKLREDVENTPDEEFGRGIFYLNPR